MPTLEDQVDVAAEKPTNEEGQTAESNQSNSQEKDSNSSQPELSAATSSSDLNMQTSAERYENPFLKPAKKIKLRLL